MSRLTAKERAAVLAAYLERVEMQKTCRHDYKTPWDGCGCLQRRICGHRVDND